MQSIIKSKLHTFAQNLSPILIFAFLLFGCGNSSSSNSPDVNHQQSGARIKAPTFEIKDLQGKEINLKDLKGKIVFLDFWATWCGPCIWSSPQVEKLHEDYKDKGVEVISISLDQSPEEVEAFIKAKGLKTRNAMAGASGVEVHYKVFGIPAFYLIDQEGFLVAKWNGFNEKISGLWRKEIDQLL